MMLDVICDSILVMGNGHHYGLIKEPLAIGANMGDIVMYSSG